MVIVMAFYFLTNFSLSVRRRKRARRIEQSARRRGSGDVQLARALTSVIVLVVGVGALLSITGADESGPSAHSGWPMRCRSMDCSPRCSLETEAVHTPYLADHPLRDGVCRESDGTLSDLISSAVFLLAFVYFATCLRRSSRTHAPRLSNGLRWKVAIRWPHVLLRRPHGNRQPSVDRDLAGPSRIASRSTRSSLRRRSSWN